jgi:hypothetical protein
MKVKIYIEDNLLDLFKDESIQFISKLSDIEKLSNVFSDYSDSFTVPATPNNNLIFKHYFDVDIDNTFNANIRVLGYIELDTLPYRVVKVQLEGVKLKSNQIDSYKITVYGATIQLTDLFKDDLLDKLDYDKVNNVYTKTRSDLSQYDFNYTSSVFLSGLTGNTMFGGELLYPLISTKREWNYGTGLNGDTIVDISTSDGAVIDTELRPALRLKNIITAIENKYNIVFSREFLNSASFENLYMWLNNKTNTTIETSYICDNLNDLTVYTDGAFDDTWDEYYEGGHIRLQTNKIDVSIDNVYGTNRTYTAIITPDSGYGSVVYDAYLTTTDGTPIAYVTNYTGTLYLAAYSPETLRLKVSPKSQFNFNLDFSLTRQADIIPPGGSFPYTLVIEEKVSEDNHYSFQGGILIKDIIPNLKVVDFISGIMKMFKLIVRPTSTTSFYIDTLDGYYSNGNILNISQFIDNGEIQIDRPQIYKTISFKYQKTSNVNGKKFRETFSDTVSEVGYGDLKASYDTIESKDELKVELPFENMMFELLLDDDNNSTNLFIGANISVSDSGAISSNQSKPILFYNNGISSGNTYYFKFQLESPITLNNFIQVGNEDNMIDSQINNTINWGEEINPYTYNPSTKSLYNNYWSNWLSSIYSLKQRKFTYNAILPQKYIEEISLNDVLIIGNNRYRINDIKIDLTNGKTVLTLFKDIYSWDGYSFPHSDYFNNRKFNNGFYFTDFVDEGTSSLLYGSFTNYDGTTVGKIIKLNDKGEIDYSFESGSGFDSVVYGGESFNKQSDGKYIATGSFSSYSGISSSRIARINSDGSYDTSFSVGAGFSGSYNLTFGNSTDSNSSVVVGGAFNTYQGNSSPNIVRILSDGSYDSSFVVGSGFNNLVNNVFVRTDDKVYVTGYFTSYDGTSQSRISLLDIDGTIDTSFNNGGFTVASNSPIYIIGNNDNSIYCYGYFTQYSGISANRIVKLTPTGEIDTTFKYGTGFNNNISIGFKLFGEKLCLYGDLSSQFTSYNGYSSNNSIVLNEDGTPFITFNTTYTNYYTTGDYLFSNESNGNQILVYDNSTPPVVIWDSEGLSEINKSRILSNSGTKYYDIITTNKVVSYEIIDGGTWCITTNNQFDNNVESNIFTIKLDNNLTGLERSCSIKFNCGDYNYYIHIKQQA